MVFAFCILYMKTLLALAMACDKLHFEHEQLKWHPGPFVKTASSVLLQDCLRLCRLIPECYHFNMIWDDRNQTAGTCQIPRPMAKDHLDVLVATSSSYYWTCPVDMIYLPTTRHCYQTFNLRRKFYRQEAIDVCHNVYPGSTLIDIEDETENQAATDLLKWKQPDGVWFLTCGIREYISSNSWQWSEVNKDFNYTNWFPGQPSTDPEQMCVVVGVNSYQWYDALCTLWARIICKF